MAFIARSNLIEIKLHKIALDWITLHYIMLDAFNYITLDAFNYVTSNGIKQH